MNPQVSIIILNWNGWEDTLECLESLYRINYLNYNVILIDNGSKDESIEKIKEYCSEKIEVNSKFFKYSLDNKPVEVFEISEKDARKNEFSKKEEFLNLKNDKKLLLIKNEDNHGFAGGNNVGMKFAIECLNSDYVLLLNNDTVVDENFLNEMVKVSEIDEKIGVVGSKIYYYDYKGKNNIIWGLGGGGVNLKTGKTWHYNYKKQDRDSFSKDVECGYITGCSMLIKNEVLKKLNGFDEDYFCYYEDTDISVRAKKLGYKLMCASNSKLWHKVSTSSGELSPFSIYILTRNSVWFVKKNYGSIFYCLSYLFSYKLARRSVNFLILNQKPKLFLDYFKGIVDGLKIK